VVDAIANIKTLNEIGELIASGKPLESLLDSVYQYITALMDVDCIQLMVYPERGKKIECRFSIEKGIRQPFFEIAMSEKNHFAVRCIEQASPVSIDDKSSSLICLPLKTESRTIGAVAVQSFREKAYTQNQADTLSIVATLLAMAIDSESKKEKLQKTGDELNAARIQLVESEKMATLGQLTAGIAHEIKNPLNFVNNFSELSVELSAELLEELDKTADKVDPGDLEYMKGILADMVSNLKKINEHGKRADSIIRGMLLQSRGKAGEKMPTDLNALLAEYVALGYHGMRASDNTFNIKIEADYDPALGLVNVVPQDVSRVFLNLINNAFYSTVQKKNDLKEGYAPVLKVSTKKRADQVTIRIWDNGKGIPKDILDRIFNPFFTTKPAGSGTGLGLSISLDIIVNDHRGELKADSVEGEYAEFVITLPII
jgi:signal transduction histidine kinase